MKETAKSLRAYFIIVGLLSAYSNVTSLLSSPGAFTAILNGASLLLAVAYLYLGAVLPTLLTGSPTLIYVVLAANAALSLVSGAVLLVLGAPMFPLLMVGVGLLICVYLWVNVKRLAAEAQGRPAAP